MRVNLFGAGFLPVPLALLGVYVVFQVAMRLASSPLSAPLRYWGQYSVVIVGLSQMTQIALKELFVALGVSGVAADAVRMVLVCVALTLAVHLLVNRLPAVCGLQRK